MKLDPEERVIPTALDQAELDDPNGRGAEAWIEFLRRGARQSSNNDFARVSSEGRGAAWWAAPQPEAVEMVLQEAA